MQQLGCGISLLIPIALLFSGAWMLDLFTDTYYIAFSGAWLLNLFTDTYYIAFFRSLGTESLC